MKKILVADDSGTARMFTRRCLEVLGYKDAEVVEVANGVELQVQRAAVVQVLPKGTFGK